MFNEMSGRDRRDLQLLRRYRTSADQDAYVELVRRYTGLIRSLARRYVDRGESLEDLTQVGMVGLVKAINRFDLQSTNRFISFVTPNVTGEMKRHFRDHVWAVHVPRGTKELQARVLLERKAADARGLSLSVAELAVRLQVSEPEALDAIHAAECFRAGSLEYPAGEDREVLDTMGREEQGFAVVDRVDEVQDAMGALTPRQRTVIEKRFGHEELLQREIGQQIGVSQMQVSRLIEQSLTAMREHLQPPATPTPTA